MQLIDRVARPFFAFFLALVSTTAIAKETEENATPGAMLIPYPHVYVADVRTSEAEPSTYTSFPAEVDLIDFRHITDKIATISFLVSDEEELDRLLKLAKTGKTKTIGKTFEMDISATEDLRKQIEYKYEGDEGEMAPQSSALYSTIANYPCYKNLQGSFAWMDAMVLKAATITGLSVTKLDIGNSYLKTANSAQGYDIWALKITGNAAGVATKGILFMMSGLHAREMTPPELASRWVETLINRYGNDADITAMLDSTEIHMVLQANPDGRQVAETNPSVLRRKNMNPGPKSCTQRGVDLNRNFPYQWGLTSGSSRDACSETYRGASAGSEPEVKAIMNYTKAIFPAAQRKANAQAVYAEATTIGVFLDIHSYSNLVLRPWSYSTTVQPPNGNALTAIRDKVQYWNNYAGTIGYTAAGTTTDYAFKELGAAAFTFELGSAFYQDCATFENNINPINQKPLMHLAKISKAPLSLSQGPDVTSVATTQSSGTLTITASASDSAWSKAYVSTAQQAVTEIRAWVDVHPHSLTDLTTTGTALVNGSVNLDVSMWTPGQRYSIYVQAKDSAGYRGPVTAAYFIKS